MDYAHLCIKEKRHCTKILINTFEKKRPPFQTYLKRKKPPFSRCVTSDHFPVRDQKFICQNPKVSLRKSLLQKEIETTSNRWTTLIYE